MTRFHATFLGIVVIRVLGRRRLGRLGSRLQVAGITRMTVDVADLAVLP